MGTIREGAGVLADREHMSGCALLWNLMVPFLFLFFETFDKNSELVSSSTYSAAPPHVPCASSSVRLYFCLPLA